MKPISRNKLVNYVRSSIDQVKETTKQPWHKHEWQKEQSADFIKENNAFLDKFESRPGEVHEILEKSEKKMKKRSFWAGTAAVSGLALTVATAVVGISAVGSGGLALGLFAAANVLWTGGVAAANLVNRGEEKFHGKLESFKQDIKRDKDPGIQSGTYREPRTASSSSDDDFMSLGINMKGEVGYNIGPGMQLGLDGTIQNSF